jgi:hypothetical protein
MFWAVFDSRPCFLETGSPALFGLLTSPRHGPNGIGVTDLRNYLEVIGLYFGFSHVISPSKAARQGFSAIGIPIEVYLLIKQNPYFILELDYYHCGPTSEYNT